MDLCAINYTTNGMKMVVGRLCGSSFLNHEDTKDTKILQGETTHLSPSAVYSIWIRFFVIPAQAGI